MALVLDDPTVVTFTTRSTGRYNVTLRAKALNGSGPWSDPTVVTLTTRSTGRCNVTLRAKALNGSGPCSDPTVVTFTTRSVGRWMLLPEVTCFTVDAAQITWVTRESA